MSIYNQETERQAIAGALRHPDVLSEVAFFVKEDDFKPGAHRTIYSAILDAMKNGDEISSFRLAEKINNAGISLADLSCSPQEYLDDIKLITISEKGTLQAFKEIKKISIRREFYEMAKSIQQMMLKNGNDTIDEIIDAADSTYARQLSLCEGSNEQLFEDVFGDLEAVIEERGNNPIQDFGIKGPFRRVNEIYGSLLRRGNIMLTAARQNQGKTQFGQYCMMDAVNRYNIPILHLDMGEMSKFELQIRATTLLTQGLISPDMLETGVWKKNEEATRIVRGVMPQVNKMVNQYYYKDVSELSPDQITSMAKRFYLSKVKHRQFALEDGLEFVIFYDYLKAFEASQSGQSKYAQEYQVMGYFMQKIKRLIQRVLPAAMWTSLQVNRIGITGNKSAEHIDDTENVFGLSDRIIQQATHAALLRRKTTEELALEAGLGNYKMIFRKARHLGPNREAHLNPVKLLDGSLRDNQIFLEGKNFTWREIGDLSTLKDKVGQAQMPEEDDGSLPAPRRNGRENVDL